MLNINNIYQLTIYTSGFVLFALMFLGNFKNIKFSNWFNFIKRESLKICTETDTDSDCESPDDLDESTIPLGPVSQFSQFSPIVRLNQELTSPVSTTGKISANCKNSTGIKKSQSQSNIFHTPAFKQEKLLTYSHTYGNLSRLVPSNSQARIILEELIKNKNNGIMACCNPHCKKPIDNPEHFAFDGYYCTESCRYFVVANIHVYWKQLY